MHGGGGGDEEEKGWQNNLKIRIVKVLVSILGKWLLYSC